MFKNRGTYSSYIHMNYDGGLEKQVLRDDVRFYDDNAFVTLWISSLLLEISRIDSSSVETDLDHQLMEGINAVADYHDKNMPGNSSLVVFWPQLFNESTRMWSCSPINLEGIIQSDEKIAIYVQKILDDIGLGFLWDKIVSYIEF